MATIKIIGLVNGEPTPYDGEYVRVYDPERDGTDRNGHPMICLLETTPDRAKALTLPARAAMELWRQQSIRDPVRPDGAANRPLTAFSVEIA